MDAFQVYKDMKARTNGEIYIGVHHLTSEIGSQMMY